MKDTRHRLERERQRLLDQWAYLPEKERARLLVRIMDIDEHLSMVKSRSRFQLPGRTR
ncbi:MAG: hypothetical protein PWP41_730 [Moorella sp. (in: firmicutes)]|nr:hypothetical protein [Moorella sp. (in: firmicutes)]